MGNNFRTILMKKYNNETLPSPKTMLQYVEYRVKYQMMSTNSAGGDDPPWSRNKYQQARGCK